MSTFERKLRNVTDLSSVDLSLIGEVVSSDLDYGAKCTCVFSDSCDYCEKIKFRFSVIQSPSENCIVCEHYKPPTQFEAALAVVSDFSVDDFPEAPTMSWGRFLQIVASSRCLSLLEEGDVPFDGPPDTTVLKSWTLGLLMTELKRPQNATLTYIRALLYEIISRRPDVQFARMVLANYRVSAMKITGTSKRQKRSVGSKRVQIRKKSEYFVPPSKPARVTRQEEVKQDKLILPPVLLSDFSTRLSLNVDSLEIGGVKVASRDEFSKLAPAFARNKGLFMEILSSSAPLSSFQSRLAQKFQSDGNFRHKLEKLSQGGLSQLQMFGLGSPSNVFPDDDLEHDDGASYASSGRSFADFRDYVPRDVLRGYPRKAAGMVSQALKRSGCEAAALCCDYSDDASERHAMLYRVMFQTVNGIARVAVTIDLIMKAETRMQKLEILYLYLSAYDVTDYLVKATEYFSREVDVLQGSVMDDFLSDAFSFVGISHVLSQFLGAPLSGMDFLRERLRSLSRMKDGDMPLKAFWLAMKRFVTAVGECFRTGSLNPLFAVGETPEEILFEAEALLTYRDSVTGLTHSQQREPMQQLRDQKKIPDYWTRTFLGSEYLDKAQELVEKLDKLLVIVPMESRALYLGARGRLHTYVTSNVNALAVNGQRLQPLGVVLVGGPGVGKTNFTKLLYRFLGTSRGFSTDASGIYSWKSDVNFQDGLNPGHWVIVGDDLDLGMKPCTAGVANHVDAIMNIVDNKPFPVESAAVDLKGTNFARPLLYLHCTNFEELKLTGFTRQEEAIHRRLPIKLFFSVLPEFARGSSVDTVKAMGHVDIHSIRVMEFSPATKTYELYKVMTTTECLRYLKVRFDLNLSQQQGLISTGQVPLCGACSIPVKTGVKLCGECSKSRLQGQGPSTMATASRALENFNEISDHVKKTDLINRVDRLTADVSEVIHPALAATRGVQGACESLTDFVVRNKGYLAVATALATMIAMYLSREELQGRVNNSTQTVPANFTRVSDVKPLGAPFKQVTFTEVELKQRIRQNLAELTNYSAAEPARAYALRVGLDSFIANRHMVESGRMSLAFRGVLFEFLVSEDTVVSIGTKDLVLIKVPGVAAAPTCLPMFWVDVDLSYSTFDSVYMVGPDFELHSTRNLLMHEQSHGYSGVSLETDCQTEAGHCGLPLVAQVGSAFRIVALHHSQSTHVRGYKLLVSARAPVISRAEIELASTQVLSTLQSGAVVQSFFPQGIRQQDLNDPMCSELALALDRGALVVNLGHDCNARQSSASKSKCQNSLLYDRVEPFCRELTGSPHYWQVPHMKGKMIDDQWHSGFQSMFKFYKNPECYHEFYGAILDYVEPMWSLDTTGYAMLSLDEAIRGVESSVINPLNFQTSIGPPFMGPKSQHISSAGFVSAEIAEQVAEIQVILDAGEIPIALSTCTLKDEPVKFSKNEKRDIRVFNNLPSALNIVTKQYFAPIQAFMRANAMVFESMVGIDMTRDGGQRIMERASLINPTLDNAVEGDFEKMDKTLSGAMTWAIVEVYKKIAVILGLDVEKVALLAWARFHVIYSIQGDLFQIGGSNPSGSQCTVEDNAIANSLAQRAVWFRQIGLDVGLSAYLSLDQPELRYRDHNVLVTYGDDFLIFHRQRLNLDEMFRRFSVLGMKVTDARKLDVPVYRSFWEVDFLKRRFRMVDGYVRCGLDMKSILRMLMISKPTPLARKEHAAIVLEEALREIFLNADPDYELWRGRFQLWADQLQLWDSKYLKLGKQEYYETMWQEKVFTPWVVPSASMELIYDESILQSKMSSSVPMTSAVGDASISSVATPATTNLSQQSPSQLIPTDNTYGALVAGVAENGDLSHASGNIISLRQPLLAGTTGNQQLSQPMADTKFADALFRDVIVLTYTNFSTATPTAFQPWTEWLANSFVADKIKNFQFIRGSIVLHGVLQVPPLAGGLVAVTCVPTYQAAGVVPVQPDYCITTLHALVDLSNSTSFEITIPWCVSSNWGNLSDQLFASSWTVTVQNISPILTAVPSGCIAAGMSLFARPGPDFELSGAKFQSGRLSRPASGRLPATFSASREAPSGNSFNVAPGHREETLQESVNRRSVSAVGMKPSAAMAAASSMAAAGAGLPYIGPALATAAGALGFASGIAKWLGFTRDTVIETPMATLSMVGNNMVNCDGGDSSQVSALFSNNTLSIDPAISGSLTAVDETSLAFIHSRYTLVGKLNYVVGSTASQDQVFGVTPCFGTFKSSNTQFSPTTAGYTGAKFVHWRGDIDYIFYPVVSAAHGGSLQVIWQPTPPSGVEPEDLTNISLNTIMDIGAAKPYHIRVGYNNDNPMAYTDFYALDTVLGPTDYSTLNGYLRVRAITPITGSVCGQNIEVLVFQAAAENMEFGLPTETVSIEGTIKTFGVDMDLYVTLQSAKIGSGGQALTSFELVPSTGPYPVVDNLMGERVDSYRALMQKPSLAFDDAAATNHLQFREQNFGPYFGFGTGAAGNSSNWFHYFGLTFMGFAGSVRVKWLLDTTFAPPFTPGKVPMSQNFLSMSGGLPLTQLNPIFTPYTCMSETLIPYQNNELFVPAYKKGQCNISHFINNTAYTNITASLYVSGGPDMRITNYRGPPNFLFGTFRTNVLGTMQLWGWNAPAMGLVATPATTIADLTANSQMTPDQYRARTGRSEFKTTGRFYIPPVLQTPSVSTATQS